MENNEHKEKNCKCVACMHGVEEADRQILDNIKKFGFACITTAFNEAENTYAYTIGRSLEGKAEYLIGYGVSGVVNLVIALFDRLDENENVSVEWVSAEKLGAKVPMILLDLPPEVSGLYCAYGLDVINKEAGEIRCRLAVFPDANGRWPWDEGSDPLQFFPRHPEDPWITIQLLEAAGLYRDGVTGPVVRH